VENISKYIVDSNIYLADAVTLMSKNLHKGLVIVEHEKVIGVFTRHDLVKSIHSFGMQSIPLKNFINYDFFYFKETINQDIMMESKMTLIPVLHKDHSLKDIVFPKNKYQYQNYAYPVVIMAGGFGTRLYPYTKILPKPLVPVNGTPMVELIIDRFYQKGTYNFYLVVNHKKEMIKTYFNTLQKEYNVYFAEEVEQLGTGGGLYLVKETLKEPFFLTNCDILLLEDYDEIYEFHKKSGNVVTMVVSVKSINVPYGVIDVDTNQVIQKFNEKPTYGMLVNTGIYVVEPTVFEYLKIEEKIDFPKLLQRMMNNGEKVGVYPITEDKWLDMGQVEELNHSKLVLKKIIENKR